MTITIQSDNGQEIEYGALTIFNLNEDSYIALIPLMDDGNPANADVSLYACAQDENGELELYEIQDEDEYAAVSSAFQRVIQAVV